MMHIPLPTQQIRFSAILDEMRSMFLQEALSGAMRTLDVPTVDRELANFAPRKALSELAALNLRGELLFAVPCLLQRNPRLLGYYRLLLGFSQKEFYLGPGGLGRFKAMETRGVIFPRNQDSLSDLCQSLNAAAASLFAGIERGLVTREFLKELTLLTLGPQLRGGANVKKGSAATNRVFEIIKKLLKKALESESPTQLVVTNAARRKVIVEFAPDPDLVIREEMSRGGTRKVIAIEIKGGTDASNIHNRLGEAEKSHQKARAEGYTECWTVINVVGLDSSIAQQESPSTDRFYVLSRLEDSKSDEYRDFRERILSLTGIRG